MEIHLLTILHFLVTLNKILFGMFSDKKLNYSSKLRPLDSMILSHLSARFIILRRYQSLIFYAKNSVRPLPQLQSFRNFFRARNGPWIETDGNLKGARSGLYAGCGNSSIPPNSWIFVTVVLAVWDLELSCCKRTLFRLTNAGYLRLRVLWTRSSCENK